MQKFIDFFEEKLAPPLLKFSQLKYIKIIQGTFISTMPIMIVGAFFLVIVEIPHEGWQNLIAPIAPQLYQGADIGTQVVSVMVAASAAMASVEYYNKVEKEDLDLFSPAMLSIASYFMVNPAQTVELADETTFTGFAKGSLGSGGIFTAIFVGFLTVEIFRYFVNKDIVIKMPEGVPPNVSKAFVALIPGAAIIIFWWLFRHIIGIDITALIQQLFEPLLKIGDTGASLLITTFLNRFLWSVGIHGGQIVSSVAGPVWTVMNVANQEAAVAGQALPYTFTGVFNSVYVWVGLAPLAFLLIRSDNERLKALGWLALPAALFNIGEPLMFGLPIVLNPIIMIPYIFNSLIIGAVAVFAVGRAWIPVPAIPVPWVLPAPIKAFLATNSDVRALIFVTLAWIFTALAYYPFIKMIEKEDALEAEAAEEAAAEAEAETA